MIDLLIIGDPMEEPTEPLDLYSAAKAVGYQCKAARELASSPAFVEAYQLKMRPVERHEWPSVLCPSLELVREQMRHRQEMNALLAELKETQQKLDDKRREMVDHYKHCPKNPNPPEFSNGTGFEIRLDPQDAKTDA